jgi:hypothetical protein
MTDFLRGAAYDGSGSAAQSSWWRPDRIPRRTQNLLIVVLAAGIAAFFGVRALIPAERRDWAGDMEPLPPSPVAQAVMSTPYSSISPFPEPGNSSPVGMSEYAVGLHELRGLPADVSSGTQLQIWVAWDPVVTEKPQVQRLLADATFVRWIEPFTQDAPMIAVLSVPNKKIATLIYGELYGQLGVTLPTS